MVTRMLNFLESVCIRFGWTFLVPFLEDPFYFWANAKYRLAPLLGRCVIKLVGKSNAFKVIAEIEKSLIVGNADHPVKLLVVISNPDTPIKLLDLAHGRFLASDDLQQVLIKRGDWFPLDDGSFHATSPVVSLSPTRLRSYHKYISKFCSTESSFPHPV